MVFFDIGETLAYPHPSFHDAIADICRSEGFDVSAHDVKCAEQVAFSSGTGVRLSPVSFPKEASQQFWLQLYQAFVHELGLDRSKGLEHRFYDRFTSLTTWRLFDDVLPALDELSRLGVRMAAISNWEDWLEQLLVHLDVTRYLEFAMVSGLVEIEKPDRRIFEMALQRAGIAPECAIHVGDSLEADVGGAKTVGITPVLVDRNNRHAQVNCHRVTDLRELGSLLSHD